MGFLVSLIIAYLLGSISCGVLIARWLRLPDPRTGGSGAAGATNCLRMCGVKSAVWVLLGDAFKGMLSIWIASALGVQGAWLGFVGLFAVVGHIFPVFFKYTGGKGIATTAGILFALAPGVFVCGIISWCAIWYYKRYVSFASLGSLILTLIYLLLSKNHVYFFPFLFITILIFWSHRGNIARLQAGTEPKTELK